MSETWDDIESQCVGTYRGGHEGKEAEAFVHGMKTVFEVLRADFPQPYVCRHAPELLERVQWLEDYIEAKEQLLAAYRTGSCRIADKALRRIEELERDRTDTQHG
jgi:hypothetical protein